VKEREYVAIVLHITGKQINCQLAISQIMQKKPMTGVLSTLLRLQVISSSEYKGKSKVVNFRSTNKK